MRTTILLLFVAFSAFGTDYVLYHKTSSPVTNQVVLHKPDYAPAIPNANYALLSYSRKPQGSNWNGVLPPLALNPATIRWTKVTNSATGPQVVPMTATESNSIITAQINAESNAVAQAQIDAKTTATSAMGTFFNSPEGRKMFAGWEATMDALNAIRSGMAGNTNMPLLTLTQLTNAIKVRIAAQANSQ